MLLWITEQVQVLVPRLWSIFKINRYFIRQNGSDIEKLMNNLKYQSCDWSFKVTNQKPIFSFFNKIESYSPFHDCSNIISDLNPARKFTYSRGTVGRSDWAKVWTIFFDALSNKFWENIIVLLWTTSSKIISGLFGIAVSTLNYVQFQTVQEVK